MYLYNDRFACFTKYFFQGFSSILAFEADRGNDTALMILEYFYTMKMLLLIVSPPSWALKYADITLCISSPWKLFARRR